MPLSSFVLMALFAALPAFALSLVVARILVKRRTWLRRPWAFWPAVGFLILYAGVLVYSATVEPVWIETTHTEIPAPRPVLGHQRFRIVHLSDLHIEEFGDREREVLELVRRANPHLILLTGDYANHKDAGPAVVAFLRELRAPYGVFGVGGNWDSKFPVRDWFAEAGARYLADEWVRVAEGRRELHVIGLDLRPKRTLAELMEGMDSESVKIVLHHKPDAIDALASAKADLFLCGHTHGGQVCLPLYGAIVPRRFERGLFRAYDTPVYVNRGVGMEGGGVPRIRLLARPEVAVLDLVSR